MTINLHGMHILVTRPAPAGPLLCNEIVEKGGVAIYFPTIAFAPPKDEVAFHQALLSLNQQDWLIFVSPQAVYHGILGIRALGLAFPSHVKFIALGASTAKVLQDNGYANVLYPEKDWSTEGLLALPEFQDLTAKNIAVLRGDGGRGLLDDMLVSRGARVLKVIAYQRVLPQIDANEYLNLLRKDMIDAIVCMSFESVKNLQLLLGEEGSLFLKHIPLLVVGHRIKELARNLGFQTIWVTQNANHEAVLKILAEKERI